MLGYFESTKGYRLADLDRPQKVRIVCNIEFTGHEMALLNVRKGSSGVKGEKPLTSVTSMDKTSVLVVIINKETAKSHIENGSFSGEDNITIDSDYQQQTVSEETESETAGPPLILSDLNVSPDVSNSDISEEIIVNNVKPI
jgi:hypothetical protein